MVHQFSPSTYTGSENIDITSNEVSLNFQLKINDEICLNPRVNDDFEIYSAPNGISFLQHNSDGSPPIAIFNPLTKSVEFFWVIYTFLTFIIKLKQMLLMTNCQH